MKLKSTTIKDVAKEIGMSVATVSRALNPGTVALVEEETRRRVLKAVGKLRYVPNAFARGLKTTRIQTIGVCFPFREKIFLSPYYQWFLSGIGDAIAQTNYDFKLLSVNKAKLKGEFASLSAGKGVGGIILLQWRDFFSSSKDILSIPTPLVIGNDYDPKVPANFVYCSSEEGGKQIGQYLISKGYRKMALVRGLKDSNDSYYREKGFKEALANAGLGLSKENIYSGDFEENGGRKAFMAMRSHGKKLPEAVFCVNDEMAAGFIKAMREAKMKCPENIAVCGFDGLRNDFNLTTYVQPLYEMGKKAVWLLTHLMEEKIKGPIAFNESGALKVGTTA